MTELRWVAHPGGLWAFNPDDTLHASVLPSLLHGVVASVGGHRRWYPNEQAAFADLDRDG